jgi:hypothetical protein
LLDIRFKLFSFARLPLLHRRWAGIAKVKENRKARKFHVFVLLKTWFESNSAVIKRLLQAWRCN